MCLGVEDPLVERQHALTVPVVSEEQEEVLERLSCGVRGDLSGTGPNQAQKKGGREGGREKIPRKNDSILSLRDGGSSSTDSRLV